MKKKAISLALIMVLAISAVGCSSNNDTVSEENKAIEKNNNARLIYSLIIAICWALVIVIP